MKRGLMRDETSAVVILNPEPGETEPTTVQGLTKIADGVVYVVVEGSDRFVSYPLHRVYAVDWE